jgi:hypothetical protein
MGELTTNLRTDGEVRERGGGPADLRLDEPYYIAAPAP